MIPVHLRPNIHSVLSKHFEWCSYDFLKVSASTKFDAYSSFHLSGACIAPWCFFQQLNRWLADEQLHIPAWLQLVLVAIIFFSFSSLDFALEIYHPKQSFLLDILHPSCDFYLLDHFGVYFFYGALLGYFYLLMIAIQSYYQFNPQEQLFYLNISFIIIFQNLNKIERAACKSRFNANF